MTWWTEGVTGVAEIEPQGRSAMLRAAETKRMEKRTNLAEIRALIETLHEAAPGAEVPTETRRAFAVASMEEHEAHTSRMLCCEGWAYLVECAGLVKIGSAKDVKKRLQSLRTGCPRPLHLLGTLPGGRAVEMRLHAAFDHRRVHGEWFALTPQDLVNILAGWFNSP